MKRTILMSATMTAVALVLATAMMLSAGPTVAFGASSWKDCNKHGEKHGDKHPGKGGKGCR